MPDSGRKRCDEEASDGDWYMCFIINVPRRADRQAESLEIADQTRL